jgi:hypothetical protein
VSIPLPDLLTVATIESLAGPVQHLDTEQNDNPAFRPLEAVHPPV